MIDAVVLAAGAGTGLLSERPQALHRVCGRPILRFVLEALDEVALRSRVVVVDRRRAWIEKVIAADPPRERPVFVEQPVPRGTADAVLTGLVELPPDDLDDGHVLVVPGDAPLMTGGTLANLIASHVGSGAAATVLSAEVDAPLGRGRVVRDRHGNVGRVVEHDDANDAEVSIKEVATSVYCFRRGLLAPALRRLRPVRSRGTFDLPGVVEVLVNAGHRVAGMTLTDPAEALGVNDRAQLAQVEHELRRRINEGLMRAGVTMIDPHTTYVDVTVTLGRDVTLFPGTVLSGRTVVGDRCEIGPHTRLVDTEVGDGCRIEMSHARLARLGDDCEVGPFASLGPGSVLAPSAVVGPFTAHGVESAS